MFLLLGTIGSEEASALEGMRSKFIGACFHLANVKVHFVYYMRKFYHDCIFFSSHASINKFFVPQCRK